MAPPRKMDVQEARYRELMGDEAADRQVKLARETCPECGGREKRHHPMCRRAIRRGRR